MCGFCNVLVCVCVDFVMCGCVCRFCNVCVCVCVCMCGFCNLCVSVGFVMWVFWQYVFLYLLCFVLFLLCFCTVSFMCIISFVCTSVRTTATE